VAVAHFLALVSPGPDFALIVRQSLTRGRGAALRTNGGIVCALMLHTAAALLGLGLLLRAYPAAFTAAKAVGAAYLAWIGVQALRHPGHPVDGAPGAAAPAGSGAWTTGFLTNVTNPKVVLFLAAIFTTVVNPATPRWVQAGYGLWMAGVTFGWFAVVALGFTREPVRRAFLRLGPWIDRTMGVVLLAFAAVLARASLR
jgi:threonine/homoserine/homoserine lactone efflux protein